MNTNTKVSQLVILGLMAALIAIFCMTPIGSIPVGPLVITLNVIPIAISAIVLGPVGGAIAGGLFGLLSFLQCFGIGVPSAMGATLLNINPFLAFVQRFIPRLLDGFLLGYIFRGVRKFGGVSIACFVTGFFSAFLNTAFFMSALVFLFGNTEYMQTLMGGKNILLFICTFVGINAVCEMVSSTIITGAVGYALYKAHFVPGIDK